MTKLNCFAFLTAIQKIWPQSGSACENIEKCTSSHNCALLCVGLPYEISMKCSTVGGCYVPRERSRGYEDFFTYALIPYYVVLPFVESVSAPHLLLALGHSWNAANLILEQHSLEAAFLRTILYPITSI